MTGADHVSWRPTFRRRLSTWWWAVWTVPRGLAPIDRRAYHRWRINRHRARLYWWRVSLWDRWRCRGLLAVAISRSRWQRRLHRLADRVGPWDDHAT